MAIDFSKPATTDNYSTGFVPNIQANQTALAQWLDSGTVSITGTPPTGAKRYNATSSAVEQWNGSAWVALPLQGINYASGNVGIGRTPGNKFEVQGAAVAFFDAAGANSITITPGATPVLNASGSGLQLHVAGTAALAINSSRFTAFGGTSAFQRVDVTGAIHVSATNIDSGGYINSMGTDEVGLAGGATYSSYSAPNYVFTAKSAAASGIRTVGGDTVFWGNTGLTAGVTFNTAERARISAAGVVTATSFSGSGAALTALNASNLASGTVANARTTGATAATANTLALRDANGDSALRALTLGNVAVAGNVLNWFEKDVSFTPVVLFAGAAATGWVFSVGGRYTRVGNCVWFQIGISVTTVGSATGAVSVSVGSLPYTPGSFTSIGQTGYLQPEDATGLTGRTQIFISASGLAFEQYSTATGTRTLITNSNMPANSIWRMNGFYFV